MKMTKQDGLFIGIMTFIVVLTGCGGKEDMKLVNEKSFTPAEVSAIRLDYDNDDITLLESPAADIILKEYMDIDKNAYYARIENRNGELYINEGRRPGGNRLNCYVELYLPAGYEADISIHTTESTLKTQVSHTLTSLRTETTHGTLELTDVNARTISVSSAGGDVNLLNVTTDTISINTANAAVNANNVHGEIQYTTTNGKLMLTAAYGSGKFDVTSDGTLDLTFAEILGDIKASAKNNDIRFTAPENASFHLIASSRNGSIKTAYDGVTVNAGQAAGDVESPPHLRSAEEVGSNPQFTVALEARNGNIEAN